MTPATADPPQPRKLLLLATLVNELTPTADRLGLQKSGSIHRGEIGPTQIVAAVIGTGPARVTATTTRLVDTHKPDAVLLMGFAGGLDPRLPAGSVLSIYWVVTERGGSIRLDRDVNTNDHLPYAKASVLLTDQQQRRTIEQSLLTIDRLASTVATKRQLFDRHRCGAVDMESYYVADLLAARGIPIAILRAVSDPAPMALPAAAANWIKPDGRVSVLAVVRHLLFHPWRVIQVWRLAENSRLAAQRLADEVENTLRPRNR